MAMGMRAMKSVVPAALAGRIAAVLVCVLLLGPELLGAVPAWGQASTWVRPPTPEDERRAAEWVRFSAENGEPWAQYMLGTMLEFGRAMPADVEAAFGWYLKAAQAGQVEAQYRCGALLHQGRGTEHDDARAAEWLRKAADADNPEAQGLLGTLYAFGQGVKADEAEAVKWWTRAAKAGQPGAAFNLAAALANGRGTAADPAAAAGWYAKAAWAFAAAGRRDDARRALEALIGLDPTHADIPALSDAVAAVPLPGETAP
jgi:TPR repeat protein